MIEALLVAVQDQLRSVLTFPGGPGKAKGYCGIEPQLRPPARMADYYISIDESGVQSNERTCLREVFAVEVAITKQLGRHPDDRQDVIYLENAKGLSAIERSIIAAIHGKQVVRVAANTYAAVLSDGSGGDIFQQPLYYLGRPRTEFRGGEWIGSDDSHRAFMVRKLNFGGGIRVQSFEAMK